MQSNDDHGANAAFRPFKKEKPPQNAPIHNPDVKRVKYEAPSSSGDLQNSPTEDQSHFQQSTATSAFSIGNLNPGASKAKAGFPQASTQSARYQEKKQRASASTK